MEYRDLFAIEEIKVRTNPHLSSVNMSLCYEHVKLRKSEWKLFLESSLKENSFDDPKLGKYKDLIAAFELEPELRVVYIARNRPTSFGSINSNQIVAYFLVKKLSDSSFLHFPIVLRSFGMHCCLEAIMEGFAIRVNIVHESFAFSTGWTRCIEWAHAPSRWNYVNHELTEFERAFWHCFKPTFELKNGTTSLNISDKDLLFYIFF